MNVVAVNPHPNPEKGHWRHVTIEENGTKQRAICFSGSAADELKLGPLPPGWTVKAGDHGPILEPPKKSGGAGGGFAGGGFRNSEAGVRFEQDRLDRRLAVQLSTLAGKFNPETAAAIYRWLRQT